MPEEAPREPFVAPRPETAQTAAHPADETAAQPAAPPDAPAIPEYARRIAKCREHLSRAETGGKGFRALARFEFIEALAALPPDPTYHLTLVELAARTGSIDEMRDIYFRTPAFQTFAEPMLRALQAVELSGALPNAITVPRHVTDWNNIGNLARFGADVLEKIVRRYVGIRWARPLIVGVLALISLYFWWHLIVGMAALWNAY